MRVDEELVRELRRLVAAEVAREPEEPLEPLDAQLELEMLGEVIQGLEDGLRNESLRNEQSGNADDDLDPTEQIADPGESWHAQLRQGTLHVVGPDDLGDACDEEQYRKNRC